MRYHLILVRMAITKKKTNHNKEKENTKKENKCEDVENICWECKLVQPVWKTVLSFLKKT